MCISCVLVSNCGDVPYIKVSLSLATLQRCNGVAPEWPAVSAEGITSTCPYTMLLMPVFMDKHKTMRGDKRMGFGGSAGGFKADREGGDEG